MAFILLVNLPHIACLIVNISWKDTTRIIPNLVVSIYKIIYWHIQNTIIYKVKITLLHKEIIIFHYESKSKFSKINSLYLVHYVIQQLFIKHLL